MKDKDKEIMRLLGKKINIERLDSFFKETIKSKDNEKLKTLFLKREK